MEQHETDKSWEEVKSILMGELVIGVPTTCVSENHGYAPVHRGINFPSTVYSSIPVSEHSVCSIVLVMRVRARSCTGMNLS